MKKPISRKQAEKVITRSFRLTAEQDKRFLERLDKAGCRENMTKFFEHLVLEQPFRTEQIDRSAVVFYSRLGNLYEQFQRVGNNYNQAVKVIHGHYLNNRMVVKQLNEIISDTRKLYAISQQILKLVEEFNEKWLHQ